jgi:hypothetical protein
MRWRETSVSRRGFGPRRRETSARKRHRDDQNEVADREVRRHGASPIVQLLALIVAAMCRSDDSSIGVRTNANCRVDPPGNDYISPSLAA